MKLKLIAASIAIAALTGCATYASPGYSSGPSSYGDRYQTTSNQQYNRMYGTVQSVRTVDMGGRDYQGPGIGAVAGAVIGGVLGNQVGSGSGRALATGAGAVAGGFAGDRIQRNTSGSRVAQEVNVRLDNGDRVTILQPGTSIYQGARVYISGYGDNARVMIR